MTQPKTLNRNLLNIEIVPFSTERFRIQDTLLPNIRNAVRMLLIKVKARIWVEEHVGNELKRVMDVTKTPNEQWLNVLLPSGLVIMITPNSTEPYTTLLGRYYGYSDCCCNVVLDSAFHVDKSRIAMEKSGFFPCDECNKKDPVELINEINKRRLSPRPFPQSRYAVNAIDALHKILNGVLPITIPQEPVCQVL